MATGGGPLHLGHYAGSLQARVALQHVHRQYLLVADAQALTDNAHDPDNVMGVLRHGTIAARQQTQATLEELRAALGLFSLT